MGYERGEQRRSSFDVLAPGCVLERKEPFDRVQDHRRRQTRRHAIDDLGFLLWP
jgi:hypothetical protein